MFHVVRKILNGVMLQPGFDIEEGKGDRVEEAPHERTLLTIVYDAARSHVPDFPHLGPVNSETYRSFPIVHLPACPMSKLPAGLSPVYWSTWHQSGSSVSESMDQGETWIGGWSNVGLYER